MGPTETIVYKTTTNAAGDAAELKLHLFSPGEGTGRSAVVFFFGGGWMGGDPVQFYPHCAYLAARGMVAMGAEYRTETGGVGDDRLYTAINRLRKDIEPEPSKPRYVINVRGRGYTFVLPGETET